MTKKVEYLQFQKKNRNQQQKSEAKLRKRDILRFKDAKRRVKELLLLPNSFARALLAPVL